MSQIHVIARFQVKPGQLEAFEKVARDFIDGVTASEPDALRYQWYASNDRTRFVVIESYRDSDAVLAHVANAGPRLPALLAAADITLEFFGPVSPALRQGTAAFGPVIHSHFGGIDRLRA